MRQAGFVLKTSGSRPRDPWPSGREEWLVFGENRVVLTLIDAGGLSRDPHPQPLPRNRPAIRHPTSDKLQRISG